jgi:hypothetical protein
MNVRRLLRESRVNVHVVRRIRRQLLIGAAAALALGGIQPLQHAAAARAVPPLRLTQRSQPEPLHISHTGTITVADGTWALPLRPRQTLHYVRNGLALIWYVTTRDHLQAQTLHIWRTQLTPAAIHGDLRSAAQLLAAIPVKGTLLSTRSEFGRGVLLLGLQTTAATTWYTLTGRAPVRLFALHGAMTVSALLWGKGMVVVARSERMWPGRIADALYASRDRASVTTLPLTAWPLVATSSAVAPLLVAGRTAVLLTTDGQIQKTAAPPLALVDAPAASAAVPAVVPSAAAAVLLTQPVQLRDLASGGYTLRLQLKQVPAICARVQPLAKAVQRRSTRAKIPVSPPDLAWFGAKRPLHSFVLGSSVGPTVTWIQAATPQAASGIWLAHFFVHGFSYSVGPFSSPANRAQTALLERILQAAAITSPRSGGDGSVNIALSTQPDAQPYVLSSEVVLAPQSGSHVVLTSRGTAAVDYASIWTYT